MPEEEISIKVNICDRFYPLRIKTSEEERLRKATKMINERAKHYIENFSVQDKQDALSMVALELASEQKPNADNTVEIEQIHHKIKEIENLL